MNKPVLIIVCGPAASGKTSVSELVQQKAPTNIAYFNHDYYREKVFRTAKTESREIRFEMLINDMAMALRSGWDVIYDTTLHKNRLDILIAEILKNLDVRLYKFYLDVDLETSKKRHLKRPQALDFGVEYLDKWYEGFAENRAGSIVVEQDVSVKEKAGFIIKEVYGKDFKAD